MGHVGFLPDADESTVFTAPLVAQDIEVGHALAPVGQVQALLGADTGTVTAEGAAVFTMLDDPGQIVIG
jgi:hypothetical protein